MCLRQLFDGKGNKYERTEEEKEAMFQEIVGAMPTEEWSFTLDDDSTVVKKVVVIE